MLRTSKPLTDSLTLTDSLLKTTLISLYYLRILREKIPLRRRARKKEKPSNYLRKHALRNQYLNLLYQGSYYEQKPTHQTQLQEQSSYKNTIESSTQQPTFLRSSAALKSAIMCTTRNYSPLSKHLNIRESIQKAALSQISILTIRTLLTSLR